MSISFKAKLLTVRGTKLLFAVESNSLAASPLTEDPRLRWLRLPR